MPSAKRWSAGESGRAAVSGAADASRSVPTGTGVTGGSVTVPGAMVLGVMVMYAIIAARGAGCMDGCGMRTRSLRYGYGACAKGLAASRNAIANVDLYLTSSWLNTMR